MRLLIDTNIILDILMAREPYYKDSAQISKLCETSIAEGYISTLTFANLAYIMRKELNPEKLENVLKTLSLLYRFEDLTATDINTAASLKWDDFEDAMQASIARRIHSDYIITRNLKDFKNSEVMALTPSELLARIDL